MYTGILAGFAQLGIVAGPLIGGALTEHVSLAVVLLHQFACGRGCYGGDPVHNVP